jgi:hypothetical protein
MRVDTMDDEQWQAMKTLMIDKIIADVKRVESSAMHKVAERLRYMAASVPPDEMADECNRLARFLEDMCEVNAATDVQYLCS